MRPLVPYFTALTPDEAQALAAGATENNQIWDASLCISEYLPQLIQTQRTNIDPKTLRALEYQLEKGKPYVETTVVEA